MEIRRTRDGATIGWIVVLAMLAASMVLRGEDATFHLNPAPVDGALHLFNPLRRIALGQTGGVDYQAYHGLAFPYLFYPVFRLAGSGLFGVELARQLYTPLALVACYVLLFAALTRSAARTVRLSALALLATIALALESELIPGTSELGVRTGFAMVVVAVLAIPYAARATWTRAAIEGLLLGLTVAVATEQGVALVAAYALVAAVEAIAQRRRARAGRLAVVLAVAAASFVATLVAIGGIRGMAGSIAYNFGAVAQDQFWYFGALPSSFLSRWLQLVGRPRITLAVLLGLVNAVAWTRRLARRRPIHPPRAFALAVLSVYGPLSAAPAIARWISGYGDAALRVAIVTTLLSIDWRVLRRATVSSSRARWSAIAAAALLVVGLLTNRPYLAAMLRAPPHVIAHHVVGNERMQLAPDWRLTLALGQSLVADHRQRTGRRPAIWSTYSGPLEAINGEVNPSFDYAIDALGPANRARYIDTFRRTQPEIVQTISPLYTTFEEWLEVTTWDLYHELMTHYRVAATGPWSVYWEREPGPGVRDTLLVRWDGSATAIGITLGEPSGVALYEAELDYEISNPWRHVPVVGQLPRFVVEPRGGLNVIPIPLAPYRTTVRFPVVVRSAREIDFVASVLSLVPGASIRIRSVRLHGLPVTPATAQWLALFVEESDLFRAKYAAPDGDGK